MLIEPGSKINQYRIVKHLGSGAHVEVYLATHIFLDIDRAIKVLRKDSPRITVSLFQEYCHRYRLEWQLAAYVHHPNLIEVYDLFEKDDALFAVVEYAPNGVLKDYLASGDRYGEDWVIQVLQDCATGLRCIHELKTPPLVHCYVNPKTVIFDANNRANITNFGRARSKDIKKLSISGSQLDDYDKDYQAPEFERGKLGPTSDVYSLGCIAFEMLTGKKKADTKFTSPRMVEPTVPEWFDKIVVRMLSDEPGFSDKDASDPSKRYTNMGHLLEAIKLPYRLVSRELLDKMGECFNFEEMRTMCYDLGVDHENIRGDDKKSYMREVIGYFQRRGKFGIFLERLRAKRPEVDW